MLLYHTEKYTLYTDAYSVLFTCYKYLLTLPISQVSCERSFSKLKFIKSRLRSTLSGNKLEAFMLINCEQDITANLSEGQIIDGLANHSKIYGNILKYLWSFYDTIFEITHFFCLFFLQFFIISETVFWFSILILYI